MRILEEGKSDYLKVDPDGYRAFVRDHKPHQMVSKLMTHQEAVERFATGITWLTTATTLCAGRRR